MSFFANAQNTSICIQDSDASLTAVGRDQQNSYVTIAGSLVHVAGNQTNYLAVPLKGSFLLLHLHQTV